MSALTRRVVGVSAAMVAVVLLASLSLTAIAQAQTTPTITSVTVSDITMTSATVTVNLADADDGTTVYLKYGPVNAHPPTNPRPAAYNLYGNIAADGMIHKASRVDEDAPPLDEDSLSGAAVFNLPDTPFRLSDSTIDTMKLPGGIQDLWSDYDVKVEASLEQDFSSGVVTENFTTLPPTIDGYWGAAGKTSIRIHAHLSNFSGKEQTVYYRYRAEGSDTWIEGSYTIPWINQTTDNIQEATGLASHTPYVIEVSSDPTFPADKTSTSTRSTLPPDLVRMGVRKITETEATINAVMDYPNGRDYSMSCRSRPDNDPGDWSNSFGGSMDGFVGSATARSLAANSPYDYKCFLTFSISPQQSTPMESRLKTLGTDPALAEISATLSGRTATITVALSNTDGNNNDVYLRHREYPTEEWGASLPRATTTAIAVWSTPLTDDTVHEFEASLDTTFPELGKLTLYLVVGNPPYATVPDSDSSTPPDDGTTPPDDGTTPPDGGTTPPDEGNTPPPEDTNTPPEDNNNGGGNQNNNPPPQNNGGGGGGFGGGGGGFGGGSQTRNTAPNFRDSARDMRTVPENSEEGVTVGEPIVAWDPQNDVITFSLRGDDAEPFTIDRKTGQILVGPDAILDYEAQNVHVVTLVVTDPDGDTATTEVEIHLTDVKLPGKADIFDVANNHNERLEKEEVEAAAAAYGLGLITKLEILFIVKYYYTTELAAIDFDNLPSMVDKYDVNADSIIDRDEVLTALQDFMAGRLSRADMREIVQVYYTTIEDATQEAEPAQT